MPASKLALVLSAATMVLWETPAFCQSADPASYAKAEELVLSRIANGKIAQFGDTPREERTVRADFVAQLLKGTLHGAPFPNEGVLIEHAVIKDRLSVAGAEIRYTTWLNDCDFEGGVDFSRAHFLGGLSVVGSRFHGDADFDGLHADGDIVLKDAVFDGLFDISGSQIHGSLNAAGAVFSDPAGQPAQFDSITGLIRTDLENVTAKVPLILDGIEAQILWLGATTKGTAKPDPSKLQSITQLNLSHATVHRELHLEGMQIETLLATSLKVEGLADFENLRITKSADLSHSQLFDLVLTDDITWPSNEKSFELAGISFQYINPQTRAGAPVTPNSKSDAEWKKLTSWPDKANYPTAPYQQVEDALRREGRIDLANAVFEEKETKARATGDLGLEATIKNFLLYALIGYGREPQRAFYWSAAVVLFGWLVVFRRREDVEPRDSADENKPYDAFWYSLDLFLPIAALEAADVWMPRQSSKFRRYYAGVHAVLGWILIPIGLAAITGLVSGK
jgi:Pentapeptide repeats (9 copies)